MGEVIHTTVLILHVIGATIIVGSSFISLFVLLKDRIKKENLELIERIWSIVGPSMGIQFITGLYLGFSEWDEIGKHPLFWTKILLFICSGIVGNLIVGTRIKAGLKKANNTVQIPGIQKWAWASFLIMMLIAICGVMLAESV